MAEVFAGEVVYKCKGCPTKMFRMRRSKNCSCSCTAEAIAWFDFGACLSKNNFWCGCCTKSGSVQWTTKNNNKTSHGVWDMPCERCRASSEALQWDGRRWALVELSTLNRDHVHYPPPPVSLSHHLQAPAPTSAPMSVHTVNASSASSQAEQIHDLQQALMSTSADGGGFEASF